METQEHKTTTNKKIKLDFKDVLIKPKRSNLCSRSDVNLFRGF